MKTEELVSKLKACKLPETMEVSWDGDFPCLTYYCGTDIEEVVDFSDDGSIASALFIIRGLTALKQFDPVLSQSTRLNWQIDLDTIMEAGEGENFQFFAPTISQAIAKALIAAYANP